MTHTHLDAGKIYAEEFEALEKNIQEDVLINVLKKLPGERTYNDLRIIMCATRNMPFFKPFFEKQSKHQ